MRSIIETALTGVTCPIAYEDRPDTFPSITYGGIRTVKTFNGDGTALTKIKSVQIDIWGQEPPDDLTEEVQTKMLTAGFTLTGDDDGYEADVGIYHNVLRFQYPLKGG